METFTRYSFPEKVRLSGADCFHLVLDVHAKKHGAGGNVIRKVFYFNHAISFERTAAVLNSSPVVHWLCNINLYRGALFSVPCWKYVNKGREIIITRHQVVKENDIPDEILDRDIPIDADRFIEADILYYPSGASAFILSWNHILLDAKGSSLLFDHLNRVSENKEINAKSFFPSPGKKTGIITHIRNMYKVKSFVQRSSRAPVSSVGNNIKSHSGKAMYHTIRFSREETEKINNNAVVAGSRFGPTHFFVACCALVIHRYNNSRHRAGDTWLPVPYDGRLKGARGPVISNSVSFLFYRLGNTELQTVKQSVKSLSEQMTGQIKNGIPQKYSMFLSMMSHVPLWLYYFIISRTGKGTFASFLYTSAGENFNTLDSLFGEPVKDLSMIPALTYPPGLTFVFLKHHNELKVEMAYSPDVISEKELLFLEQELRQHLLDNY